MYTSSVKREPSKGVTADELISLMDDAHISRAVVLSTAYSLANPHKPPVPNEPVAVRNDNEWTSAQVAMYPDRLIGFCSVNPLQPYAVGEINRCGKDPNLRTGLKLHFGNSDVNVDNPAHLAQLKRVFRAVLAHMAGACGFDKSTQQASAVYAAAIARHDPRVRNLYFDACISADAAQAPLLAQRIREIGVSRIFYGSDAPVRGRPTESAWKHWPRTRRDGAGG